MRYVGKDPSGKLVTFGATGFVPKEALGPAPSGDYADADLEEPTPGTFRVNETKKAARIAAEKAEKDAAKAAADAIKAVAKKTGKLTNDEIETLIRKLALAVFGE